MRTRVSALLAALALVSTGVAHAQQQRWAAIDPNREVSSAVAWGSSETQARERSVEACEKVSKTCAGSPAITNEMDDVFSVMCCTRPKLGCAIAPADSREDAVASLKKKFSEAGFSNCNVRQHLSAGSGKKQ